MFCYLYEFLVEPTHADAFTREYGAGGAWVRFFSRDPAYLGTELHRDVANPLRFITIDRWTSREACLAFRDRFRAEFDAIDLAGERFTTAERHLGDFESC